jgi:hypothetical protein
MDKRFSHAGAKVCSRNEGFAQKLRLPLISTDDTGQIKAHAWIY